MTPLEKQAKMIEVARFAAKILEELAETRPRITELGSIALRGHAQWIRAAVCVATNGEDCK